MKHLILGLLMSAVAGSAFADKMADDYFKDVPNPPLNRQENTGLRYSHDFSSDGRMATPPGLGEQGRLMFPLGSNPSIVCAVLQVCDIALQPGEQLNSLNAGDTARWDIQPAISGKDGVPQMHILIKPFDVGLQTTLFIATDRRTFHLRLKSHRSRFMPAVGFIYPEDQQAALQRARQEAAWKTASNVLPSGQQIDKLDFEYNISGDSPSWKPLRVYNDGTRTYIQMPASMAQGEAPTLLIVRDGEDTLVNYRLDGDRFVVDTIFDKAVLLTGVGRHQSKVVITRKQP